MGLTEYIIDCAEDNYAKWFAQKEEEHKTGKLDNLIDKLSGMIS